MAAGAYWVSVDQEGRAQWIRLGSKPGYNPHGLSPSDLPFSTWYPLKVSRHSQTAPIAEEQVLKQISLWGTYCIQNIATSSISGRVVIQRHRAHDLSVWHSETLKLSRKWKSELLLHRSPPASSLNITTLDSGWTMGPHRALFSVLSSFTSDYKLLKDIGCLLVLLFLNSPDSPAAVW